MRRLSSQYAAVLVPLALAALAALAAALAPGYYVTLLVMVGTTALAATGLTLLLISGQVSLGQAAYVGIGAYGAALLARDLAVPTPLALIGGVLASVAAALLVGLLTRRLKGFFLPLATLAVGIAVHAALVAASGITGGSSGLGQIPPLALGPLSLAGERSYAVFVWVVLAVVLAGLSRLVHARAGRAVAAASTHPGMAEVFGVRTGAVRLAVFVAAAGLAGLSGALYAFFFRFLSPTPFDLSASFNLLIASVLGGAAHPLGALVGAATLVGLDTVLQNTVARALGLSGHVQMMAYGIVLVAVLLKWPGGIWSALGRLWPRFRAPRPAGRVSLKPAGALPDGALLKVEDVQRSFGGVRAVRGVSFEVGPGEIVALIGPNGAGKSTTFDLVTGLTAPDAGWIDLMGAPPPRGGSGLSARGVARTFQHVKLVPTLSVIENVAVGCHAEGRSSVLAGMFGWDRADEAQTYAKAWKALEVVGLADLADAPVGRLAMGQARLLEVARALVVKPRLLLLDEPAAGLRTGEKVKLLTLLHHLRRAGASVLLVEHDMDLVMNGVGRIVVLERGSPLSAGTPEEVRNDPRVIAAYLGY